MNQELNEYIKKAKEAGQDTKQIKLILLNAGYAKEVIDDLLKSEPETKGLNKNIHFYLIEIIAIIELLFWLFVLFISAVGFIFSAGVGPSTSSMWNYGGGGFTILSVAILGILGLTGSAGLIMFKKWGLSFTLVALCAFWFITLLGLNSMYEVGNIPSDEINKLIVAIVLTIMSIYLFFCRDFFD